MAEPKLRYDLVTISSSLSLAQDVAPVDQLGEDPAGGAFGDADGSREVAQAEARVIGHTGEDVGVGSSESHRPEIGAGMLHISRSCFHE